MTLRVVGGDEREVSNLRQQSMIANPKELHWQRPAAYTKDRLVSSSDRAPHKNKAVTVNDSSESESHFTTDGQSASVSWHKAPIWGLVFVVPSLTRGRVSLSYMLLVLASAVLLRSQSLWTHFRILLPQI